MTCNHGFVFGDMYQIRGEGICNNCGASHDLENLIVRYDGDLDDIHHFAVITVFACPGCHLEIREHRLFCNGINITAEMQTIQRHK